MFSNFVYTIAPQAVASLQNLVNKHILEVPPVFNELTIKTTERLFTVFIFNFGHIPHHFLVFLLMSLNKYMLAGAHLSTYKRWNNILLQLLTDVQKSVWNRSSKEKTVIQSSCSWKHFFLVGYCVSSQRTVFFQSTVFLCFFSYGHHSLKNTMFFRRALAAMNCLIYNVFDRYIYLRRIVISKEHLQLYI